MLWIVIGLTAKRFKIYKHTDVHIGITIGVNNCSTTERMYRLVSVMFQADRHRLESRHRFKTRRINRTGSIKQGDENYPGEQ